ncbi:MAG: toxin-activating lysine-acyltransferase [Microcoleaceae cyanobacterium]
MQNSFHVLGKVSWLWASSSLHRNWPVSLLAINVLPAIQLNQYVLLTKNNFPIAFCSWANLSLDNEIKYLNDVTSLIIDDWNSGERKWFIDWITPFGDSHLLYKHMRDEFPYELFRAIRVNTETTTGKISEFHGGKVDKKLAKKIFNQYHHELIDKVKKNSDFKFSLTK